MPSGTLCVYAQAKCRISSTKRCFVGASLRRTWGRKPWPYSLGIGYRAYEISLISTVGATTGKIPPKGALPPLYSLIFFYSLLVGKSVFRTSYLHNALKASAKIQLRSDAVSAVIPQNKSLNSSPAQFGAIATFLNGQQVDLHKSYSARFPA